MNESALRKPSGSVISKEHIPFEFDGGVARRARIGFIVLATDNTLEHELRQIIRQDGVAFYETRIFNDADINPTTLAAMAQRIEAAASLILPGIPLDVVGYGCTSGSVVIGEERVFELIRKARPGVACTTPITGAIAGLKAMGCKRIALLTPYLESVNQMLRQYIEQRGIGVPVMGSFNHENDNEVARISQESIRNAVRELMREPNVDGVFVSCTSLRVASIVEEMEAEFGRPVTSSNHAMAWHSLRLAGLTEPVPGFGKLFRV